MGWDAGRRVRWRERGWIGRGGWGLEGGTLDSCSPNGVIVQRTVRDVTPSAAFEKLPGLVFY